MSSTPTSSKHIGTRLSKDEFQYAFGLYDSQKRPWLFLRGRALDDTVHYLLEKPNERSLFLELLDKFDYVDARTISQCFLPAICNHITQVWALSSDDTVILPTLRDKDWKNKNEFDGSEQFVQELRSMAVFSYWDKNRFFHKFISRSIPKDVKNVVICDDFIGTGGTIRDAVNRLKGKGLNLYVVSLAAMKIAKVELNQLPIKDYYTSHWVDGPAFDIHADTVKRSSMRALERKLSHVYNGYNLDKFHYGYCKSGALFFHELYRIPNNVYPIFWWGKLKNESDFLSLFRRL